MHLNYHGKDVSLMSKIIRILNKQALKALNNTKINTEIFKLKISFYHQNI